jgi:1,2-beta-oligoglucan phosphorylase
VSSEQRWLDQYPLRILSPAGLAVQVNSNGSLRRMDHGDIMLNLFLGNEMEPPPANLYLRRHGEKPGACPLLGPQGGGAAQCDGKGPRVRGAWQDIRFSVSLVLAGPTPAWFWHVELENTGTSPATLDLIYAQDLALAHYGAVRLNEYYVSHYLDHTPLFHPQRRWVVASRQNQSMGGRNPWCLIGAMGEGVSYATDALQVHGLATRAGQAPAALIEWLPGARLQHEHGMAAIQDAPFRLEPGALAARGFFGWFEPDHPAATSDADLAFVERALALPEAAPVPVPAKNDQRSPAPSLFATAPLLDAADLAEAEIRDLFGEDLREVEREDGRLWSFFAGDCGHVVLKAKELQVLRPHGHILRTGGALTPDEAAMTSTVWMAGVFHSMVTQGHVSINRLLSTIHSYLGLFRSQGQRLFVELGGVWRLLDVPSAFEMTPQACRWYCRYAEGLIRVESRAPVDRHELCLSVDVLSGPGLRFLLANHLAINGDDGADPVPVQRLEDGQGVFVRPNPGSDVGRRFPDGGFRLVPAPGTPVERLGGDELLFPDGVSRAQPFLCLRTRPASSIGFRLIGCLLPAPERVGPSDEEYWRHMRAGLRLQPPSGSALAPAAFRLAQILPWFAHNALIHYLSPRGLEQYSGGGWGTRDVTQGPVEMLLALGRPEPVRDLLVRVFKNQNPDGDWPQWFMFFERERNIRPPDAHGDIVFWPLLALGQYLLASGDAAFLEETFPFFHPDGDVKAERGTLRHHVERALALIRARCIPGTHLPAYGNGDWNDSLQPVDPKMRQRLCSAWTATLHYQTLTTLADAFRYLGLEEAADACAASAEQGRQDFLRLLLVDGILTGFAYFKGDGDIDYLLHPRDGVTGVAYSLLAMVYAIIDGLLTPEQAGHHLALIQQNLLGPDGARLFDWPMNYRGGPQTRFQRAESSAFFGREIGLMYTHAHLRYAEALWRYGDAEGFFRALCQANPIGVRDLVPAAAPRQANCYFSSSDAAFTDRYEADARYAEAMRGEIRLEGGWRVYSSGAGIGTSLILRCFLGLRRERGMLVIDPVMPASLDGLRAGLELLGHSFEVTYRVPGTGCGPSAVRLNGAELSFARGRSPYRIGAAEVPMDAFLGRLTAGVNRLGIAI